MSNVSTVVALASSALRTFRATGQQTRGLVVLPIANHWAGWQVLAGPHWVAYFTHSGMVLSATARPLVGPPIGPKYPAR